ncbi:MAG: hypothetical protein ABI402_11275 [Ferruginibacter sp.]
MQIQRSLKKAMKDPLSVQGLDLRQLKPILLFPEIDQFINLEFIDISNCPGLDWKDACIKLSQLPKLTEVKAFGAGIKMLPPEFGLLKNLKKIDFASNTELKMLPESFSNLIALEDISFYGCGLETLTQSEWNFPNLLSLSLGRNKLKKFPEQFFKGLAGLQELNISNNQLESLPESICDLENLKSILAGSNLFQALPVNFAQLTSLETLWLDSCPAINYDNELEKIKNTPIRNLSIFGNNISMLPAVFKDIQSLEVLNINSNKLDDTTQLVKDLSQLPLKELDIRFMGKREISLAEAQSMIPTLQKIACDTRTNEEYGKDILQWVSNHLETAEK